MGSKALSETIGLTRKEEIVASFDDVLSHPWESVELSLKGVSEEEALYQHPAYSREEREAGYPLSGSVFWHVVHLAHCYLCYADIIRSRPTRHAEPPPPEAENFQEGIANLKLCRADLRESISDLTEDQFDEKIYDGRTVSGLIRMIIRHDAWHGGQIAVAKRLYRMR